MSVNLKILPGVKPTQQQKADYVEKQIARQMEEEDKKSGAINIPYFLRAADEVKQIQNAGNLDKVYKEMKKGK